MIIGILLGISLAINITSLIFIIISNTGILKENIATGAVIGVAQASNYAFATLILSLITTTFLILLLKSKKSSYYGQSL